MDKHKRVRNHIAAAKGWLNQAEESLERENDIRGDLNLMLAQAELRSAQEKQPQKRWLLWGRRLLPLVAALCVAAGYVAYLRPVPSLPAPPPVPAAAEMAAESGVNGSGVAAGQPVAGDGGKGAVPAAAGGPVADVSPSGREALLPQEAAGTVPDMAGQAEKPASHQADVPGVEMQQLMQAAGNVLRE